MEAQATVFVVDDDPGVRRSMRWLLESDELDINPPGGEPMVPPSPEGVAAIVGLFDSNMAKLKEILGSTNDEVFGQPWTLKSGGEEVFTMPKGMVLRGMVINHMVHHRGQLTTLLSQAGVEPGVTDLIWLPGLQLPA